MEAPDRSADVRRICAEHPEAFGEPLETNDARRLALLTTWIIPMLNEFDDHQWGLLRKDDQGGKIPCDVLLWHPSMEHFDVLTGTGATWIPHGRVTNPAWVWQAVPWPDSVPAPPPDPAPAPEPPPQPDREGIVMRLEAIEHTLETLVAALPALRDQLRHIEQRPFPHYSNGWLTLKPTE